ncbi:MAG TPA: hypothetical protein VNJ10_12765 [Sphingomonas sp.]|nr:hypothetical protein [Sphingomonas sp.]
MTVTFQEIVLDVTTGDDEALLVMREGRLVAVLCRLGPMHGDLTGKWFVEAMFAGESPIIRQTFADPDEFSAWLHEAEIFHRGQIV